MLDSVWFIATFIMGLIALGLTCYRIHLEKKALELRLQLLERDVETIYIHLIDERQKAVVTVLEDYFNKPNEEDLEDDPAPKTTTKGKKNIH